MTAGAKQPADAKEEKKAVDTTVQGKEKESSVHIVAVNGGGGDQKQQEKKAATSSTVGNEQERSSQQPQRKRTLRTTRSRVRFNPDHLEPLHLPGRVFRMLKLLPDPKCRGLCGKRRSPTVIYPADYSEFQEIVAHMDMGFDHMPHEYTNNLDNLDMPPGLSLPDRNLSLGWGPAPCATTADQKEVKIVVE